MDAAHIHGGVEASVYGLAQELAKKYNVSVFDVPRSDVPDRVEMDGNAEVRRFNRKLRWNISDISRLDDYCRLIVDEHASVVHIHGTGIFSSLLYNRLKKVGQNVVLTVHGILTIEQKNALNKKFTLKRFLQYKYQTYFERLVLNNCKNAIVDTDYVREMLNSISLKHTPNMFTIPQGIADVYFNLKHQDAEHKIVLAVGGLSGRKGHLITMRAFDKIADKHKDAELIIAGCVTSAPYYRSMMELKDSLPHGDRITILPDADYDVLLGLYSKATLFALHSEEESQGIVFAEAMAAGLPIVATNSGGIPYVVHDDENGILCKYGDVDAFASNMDSLLSDETSRNLISARNTEEAKKYNWANIANEIVKVYSL